MTNDELKARIEAELIARLSDTELLGQRMAYTEHGLYAVAETCRHVLADLLKAECTCECGGPIRAASISGDHVTKVIRFAMRCKTCGKWWFDCRWSVEPKEEP